MDEHYIKSKGLHLNYKIITEMIESNASVVDVGCGDGTLMKMLQEKKVQVTGIDIDQDNIIKCLEKRLSVIQGDIDEGLLGFPDKSYDYVILNQTLQSTEKPDFVIQEMLRIGKKVVISFPNFAYWKIRFYLMFQGKMPKSKILPFEWYNTPNIHLLTIKDFYDFAKRHNFKIEKEICMTKGKLNKSIVRKIFNNFLTEEVMFLCTKN